MQTLIRYSKVHQKLKNTLNVQTISKAFTKLRLSDHNLMIEEGRRKRPMLPRIERLCNTCNKLVF